MKAFTFEHRGTRINKIQFSQIEDILEEKGFNVNDVFSKLADENEFIYVSNGFVNGLEKETNEPGEWHHYFVKDGIGSFDAHKLYFC